MTIPRASNAATQNVRMLAANFTSKIRFLIHSHIQTSRGERLGRASVEAPTSGRALTAQESLECQLSRWSPLLVRAKEEALSPKQRQTRPLWLGP